jgi:Flp pilus assembly protein TadD
VNEQIQILFRNGNGMASQSRYAEAANYYKEVVRIDPQHFHAQNNLAVMYAELGKIQEAIPLYQLAIAINPIYTDAQYNLANAFKAIGNLDQAAIHYRSALQLNPSLASAHINLAICLMETGNLAKAVEHFELALQIQPHLSLAHNGLGLARSHLGQRHEAMACYDRALQIEPGLAEAHYNRALALLLNGDFAQGWDEYEWRWRLPEHRPRTMNVPKWEGEDLAGKTILLHTEQGIGDTIQFVRFAKRLQGLGSRVLLDCKVSFHSLLRGCPGIDQLVDSGLEPLPHFDFHCPLMSLAKYLAPNVASIPCSVPYIMPNAVASQHWQQELEKLNGYKIGIAWQGSAGYRWDQFRSVHLSQFEPISRVSGVQLIGLQKGPGSEQLTQSQFHVFNLAEQMDNDGDAFVDTAALIQNLDLVICIDSAIAHLAGAMGVRAWVALPIGCDWRWYSESNSTSPWYPATQLHRQSKFGDWQELFLRMTKQLESELAV